MPTYTFSCAGGHRFEGVQPMSAPPPSCPGCGGPSIRRPSAVAIAGRARAGRPLSTMPQTWRGTYGADREYVKVLRHEADRRVRLEERHPELRGESRRIVAHEGPYAQTPLYEGEPLTNRGSGGPSTDGPSRTGGEQ